MFLQSSTIVYPDLYLVTLGATCRYAIVGDDGAITITDPGASLHIPALEKRLSKLDLDIKRIRTVLLTHVDPDRCAGLALLRRCCPEARVCGTAAMQKELSSTSTIEAMWEKDANFESRFFGSQQVKTPELSEFREAMRIDAPLVETDSVQIGEDFVIRSIVTPGHRAHSVSYTLIPHGFVIGDETFGYYRGSKLAAPGSDFSMEKGLESLSKFEHIEISGIGFSYGGAVTGSLARKHFSAVTRNCRDLAEEYDRAVSEEIPLEEIEAQIREGFFTPTIADPFLTESITNSGNAIISQLKASE